MFTLGSAVNVEGYQVPAWGFEHAGDFIVNARVSACGRFHADPQTYALSDSQATELARLNAGRDLLAYWDI